MVPSTQAVRFQEVLVRWYPALFWHEACLAHIRVAHLQDQGEVLCCRPSNHKRLEGEQGCPQCREHHLLPLVVRMPRLLECEQQNTEYNN